MLRSNQLSYITEGGNYSHKPVMPRVLGNLAGLRASIFGITALPSVISIRYEEPVA